MKRNKTFNGTNFNLYMFIIYILLFLQADFIKFQEAFFKQVFVLKLQYWYFRL